LEVSHVHHPCIKQYYACCFVLSLNLNLFRHFFSSIILF
jgi:hypothetical protein